jgi:Uma2 family endonuclease
MHGSAREAVDMLQRASPITADQLLRMPDDDCRTELVRGRLITLPPPGAKHGVLVTRISRALASHVERHSLGIVLVESGYRLASEPDTVRGPDVSFIATHRLVREPPDGYWKGAPDLAVEIVSPGERSRDVERKVREYLTGGARVVWVVHPRTRTLTRHPGGGTAERLSEHDTLFEPDVLAGFRYELAKLFAPLTPR